MMGGDEGNIFRGKRDRRLVSKHPRRPDARGTLTMQTMTERWWMEVRMRTGAIAGCLAVMTLFGLLTRTAPFATRNIPEARGLQKGGILRNAVSYLGFCESYKLCNLL